METDEPGGPRWYEDIPWRIGYRLRQLGLFFFGPAQLDDDLDPSHRLKRERRDRYARRRGDDLG